MFAAKECGETFTLSLETSEFIQEVCESLGETHYEKKTRWRKEQLVKREVLWPCRRMRNVMRRDQMHDGMEPLKDSIYSTWNLTTHRFLQRCRVAIPLQWQMQMDGKDIEFYDKIDSYKKIGMECHRYFYVRLHAMGYGEEIRRQSEMLQIVLAEQFK